MCNVPELEKPMEEYEVIKDIRVSKIKAEKPCADAFKRFLKKLIEVNYDIVVHNMLIPPEVIIPIAEEMNEVQWLIDKGFIREKKEEVFYRIYPASSSDKNNGRPFCFREEVKNPNNNVSHILIDGSCWYGKNPCFSVNLNRLTYEKHCNKLVFRLKD